MKKKNKKTSRKKPTTQVAKPTIAVHNSKIVQSKQKMQNNASKNINLVKEHPLFPFWARLKINKSRTTLVIDEEKSLNKKTNKIEDQFVHREATTPNDDDARNKKYERISPNPDKTKKDDMLLKKPTKLPKILFKPHGRNLDMPKELKDKYDKNNYKEK